MSLKEELKQMSPYEKWKLRVDFLRFIATLGAPFIMILTSYLLKKLGII